jgi:hypothetical protein
MANLGTLPIIKADPNIAKIVRTDLLVYKALKFGASMTSAGQGSVSDSAVSDQGVVEVPTSNDPIQYWG